MQDVAPPKPAPAKQSEEVIEDTIKPEIVSGLGVKSQGTSSKAGPAAAPVATAQPATKDDQELDNVLESVNKQIKIADSKPPRPSIFKRWESVFVTIVALIVAVALCVAAISAFKQ